MITSVLPSINDDLATTHSSSSFIVAEQAITTIPSMMSTSLSMTNENSTHHDRPRLVTHKINLFCSIQ